MTQINAIYLSGWEYNRLLKPDPFTPSISALPGEIFWNGAAHLWLFEKIYCTQESYDNEVAAYESMHWTTGKIFQDLAIDEILEPIDLRQLSKPVSGALVHAHRTLKAAYEEEVRTFIANKNTAHLEALKLALLQPVLQSKGCLPTFSPNSLKHWDRRRVNELETAFTRRHSAIQRVLVALSDELSPGRPNGGILICRSPGYGLTPEQLARLKNTQETGESPKILDLLANEGRYAGEKGYQNYYEDLNSEGHAPVYAPVDERLLYEWSRNRDTLIEIRRLAKKHLWPKLHGEWLPKLNSQEGESFANEFGRLLDNELRQGPIAKHLTLSSQVLFGITAASSATTLAMQGLQLFDNLAELAKSSEKLSLAITAASGGAGLASSLIGRVRETQSEQYGNVALFYQQARRELSTTH